MRIKPFELILLACSLIALPVLAQDPTPVKPANYTSNVPRSYVRTWVAAAPATDPNVVIAMDVKDAKQTTVYHDGLGRVFQSVLHKGSLESGGTATDMVSSKVYDAFGHEVRTYLLFSSSENTGAFKLNPFDQQKTFYDAHLAGQGETFYYSKTDLEAAPLSGRQLKKFAEGNSWVNEGRAVQTLYYSNTTTDDVRKWTVNDVANSWPSFTMDGPYTAGQLFKKITINENGKQTVEFRNKDDKPILKKEQLTALADDGTGRNHDGWLCTYYLYDNLGNLRCVVQPAGVQSLILAGWVMTAYSNAIINEQCFLYEYDERNRLCRKKVPGGGESWMVYDQWDRLVLIQDANLRQQNKWIFTKYDHLNRKIATGFYTYTTLTQSSMQQYVNSQNLARYENYNPASFPVYSLNLSFPQAVLGDILGFTFYDDYSWATWYGSYGSKDNGYDSYFPTSSLYPYPQPLTQSTNVKGKVTGVWDNSTKLVANYYDDQGRVIQTKTLQPNSGNAVEILTTQYSFNGKVVQTVLYHPKNGDNAQTHLVITKMSYDDAGRLTSVKKSVTSNLQGGVVINKPEVEIIKHEYDRLGVLKHKHLGKKKDASGVNYIATHLESLTYDYNIRGWLLGMNRDQVLTTNGTSTRQFGFELGYDKQTNKALRNFNARQFNGNVTGVVWKTNGDGIRRKYDFSYDANDRILQGIYEQNDLGSTWGVNNANYNVKLGDGVDPTLAYDANGNVIRLQQWGLKLSGNSQIDDMLYSYYDYSNKLKAVTEQGAGAQDHKLADFTDNSTGANDYGYDKNGNMVTDLNRRLNGTTGLDLASGGAITYNHFNLPVQIIVKDNGGNTKGTISYTYDPFGNKLSKQTVENPSAVNDNRQITTTSYYIGGFVYESKTYSPVNPDKPNYAYVLQYITHEEGRIRFKPAGPGTIASLEYDFFLKDQAGNIRMVLTDETNKTFYPAATLEGSQVAGDKSMINFEKKFYTINTSYVVTKGSLPAWSPPLLDYENNNGNPPANTYYPSDYTTAPSGTNDKLYRLNATSNKTGLGFVIKVMAGDRIDIHGRSYYHSNLTFNNSNSTPLILTDIIAAFLGTPGNAAAAKGVTIPQMEGWNTGPNGIPNTFIRGSNGESSSLPKAYINFIFFDDQFRYAGGNFSRVRETDVVKRHWFEDPVLQNIPVTKNGYLYVYVTNESNENVYFDGLQVLHTKGMVLEETHYYPFGLTMAAISSKALDATYAENKKGYNGNELQHKEFSDGAGLEMYDFNARTFDPQTGRFIQIDPESEEGSQEDWSPYHFGYDNPVRFGDADGKFPIILVYFAAKFLVGVAIEYGSQIYSNYREGKRGSEMFAPQEGLKGLLKMGISGLTASAEPAPGMSRLATFGVKLGMNTAESVLNQVVDGKKPTFGQTLLDLGIGAAASKVKVQNLEEIAQKQKKYDEMAQAWMNNPTPALDKKASKAREELASSWKKNEVKETRAQEATEAGINQAMKGSKKTDAQLAEQQRRHKEEEKYKDMKKPIHDNRKDNTPAGQKYEPKPYTPQYYVVY